VSGGKGRTSTGSTDNIIPTIKISKSTGNAKAVNRTSSLYILLQSSVWWLRKLAGVIGGRKLLILR